MTRPRIAILSSDDTRSRATTSGTPYYMTQALQRHCGEVVHLGPVVSSVALWGKLRNRATRALFGKSTAWHHTASLARDYARHFARRLRDAGPFDLIFAPLASTEIAMLGTDLPIIYTSDATFQLACDYHPGFTGLPDAYRAGGNAIERAALHRAAAVTYPTEWAARSAREFYGVDPDRISVVPWGANLDEVPDRDTALSARRTDRCALLFLGVNWERKGGPIAFEAVAELRRRGVNAHLTVCGCVPPEPFRADWLRVIPRLDKEIPAARVELSRMLLEAHFLILPTRNDMYGIAFVEAAAHGTPSIAPDTGGVGGAVADGISGRLLPAGADATAYADALESLIRDEAAYERLRASSREHYERCANWDRWAMEVATIARRVLAGRTT